MRNALSLIKETPGPISTWKLSGDLILEDTAMVRKELYIWLNQEGLQGLRLDLSDLIRIDASGISLLVSFQNVLSNKNCTFQIRNVPNHIYAIFEKHHLDLYFDIKRANPKDNSK